MLSFANSMYFFIFVLTISIKNGNLKLFPIRYNIYMENKTPNKLINKTIFNRKNYKGVAITKILYNTSTLLYLLSILLLLVLTIQKFFQKQTTLAFLMLLCAFIILPALFFLFPYLFEMIKFLILCKRNKTKELIYYAEIRSENILYKDYKGSVTVYKYEDIKGLTKYKNYLIISIKKKQPLYLLINGFINCSVVDAEKIICRNTNVKLKTNPLF